MDRQSLQKKRKKRLLYYVGKTLETKEKKDREEMQTVLITTDITASGLLQVSASFTLFLNV